MSGVETRGTARDSLFLFAELSVGSQATGYRVKIRNLSALGMMAEGEAPVTRGTRVHISARDAGTIAGTVAWREGSRFGIAFEAEINPAEVREALLAPQREVPKLATYVAKAFEADPAKLRTV